MPKTEFMPSKKCIVSFASHGRENYNAFLLGLIRSCHDAGWRQQGGEYYIRSFDGYVDEYLGVKIINGSYPVTDRYGAVNNHEEIPWGFKPHLILEAAERGYEQIIWCDSKIRMLKYPGILLELAKERGVVAFENLGHPLKNYLSDLCQERLFLKNEELDAVKQIMGCMVIFDLTNPVGVSVLNKWIDASRDGVSFQNYGSKRPGFIAHRNDQASLSGILYNSFVSIEPYGGLCYPPFDKTKEFGEPYFVNSGQ